MEAEASVGTGCPPSLLGGNEYHISQEIQQSISLAELLFSSLAAMSDAPYSLEHCVLILRLPTALHRVGHVTVAICNEYCYPCFKTSSNPKVKFCVVCRHFSRGCDSTASPAPQTRAMCNTILTSEFPAADAAKRNHNLCILVIDLLVLC